ncbi:hypothetical protein DFQ27_006940 [Actinomortierella ambigua]|uniref:PH domain-containing protein n=1 Tax=Actinomortierella ambigua TaxID=1343610 RepID=A0A9P6PUF7_9FUNG|nr:hypothetical protein DFQ27_006940 [Actinomortierella ambigua]
MSLSAAPAGEDPRKMLKILEALQKGDLNTLSVLLPTYKSGPAAHALTHTHSSSTQSFEAFSSPQQSTPIHLAVQCATFPVVEYVINNLPQVDLNQRDSHGSTALHIAASSGKLDVVKLLLSKDTVNDGILDSKQKSPLEVASTPEIRMVINAHRTQYITKTTTLLHKYAEAGDLKSLQQLFDDPRAAFVLNISHQDTETGSTILHAGAKRKDMQMVQWALDQGIDSHLCDKKGKLAADVTKDSKIKSLLKEARSQGPIAPLVPTSPGQPPKLQGTLFKWTNYASGYKARWFVLEDGVLSYYHNQEDAGNACRGSINLGIAKLWIDAVDKQRFDIIGKGSIRYHLKAGHATEAKRWIFALTQTKQWISDTSSGDKSRRQSISSMQDTRPSASRTDTLASSSSDSASQSRGRTSTLQRTGSNGSRSRSSSTTGEEDSTTAAGLPHADTYANMTNFVKTQIQMQADMNDSLVRLQRQQETPEDSEIMKTCLASLEASMALKNSIGELVAMTNDREQYWQRILKQESQKRELWEESMRTMSEEQLEMQRLLTKAEETNRKMKKNRTLRSKSSALNLHSAKAAFEGASTTTPTATMESEAATPVTINGDNTLTPTTDTAGLVQSSASASVQESKVDASDSDSDEEEEESGDEFFDAVGDDEVVEFSDDAISEIDGNEDAQKDGPASEEKVGSSSTQVIRKHTGGDYIASSVAGYPKELRTRLPTKQTSLRPDISLWAILKNSIGKDLSKITLPVYFNEPTSMLQRMAEDAEYIQVLDKAARQRGATERILFVAAFAMSNYSSTIGRVAKPFNPLLGETYEYVRKDRQFRYISEQVSHHPPISACYCDSPNYNFYAEVDVKSKFWGKSFEVLPKGTSNVELKVPKSFAEGSNLPMPTDPDDESKFVEHYSWKKVTTCVQNLIVGTPWIDHYGDMIITNHHSGETCKLTFKPRGWRGKDAFEIRGFAYDRTGKEVWEVAGRWSERLVARRAGTHRDDLGSDAVAAGAIDVDGDGETSNSPASPTTHTRGKSSSAASILPKQVLLLWKRDPVPSPTPFNLTPFAMTLNDCPEELKPFLCPTDCRLRPDQHAMESGEFDLANTEKQRLEEKQRAKRRAWPEGYHPTPRWFRRSSNGEGWEFVGRDRPGESKGSGEARDGRTSYWSERARCGPTDERPTPLKWDVEDDDLY